MQKDKQKPENAWLFYLMMAIFFAMFVLSFTFPVKSDDHHKYHADFYSKWTTPEGGSCCNHNDCRPAESRTRGESTFVLLDGEWVEVPKEKVRPFIAPDMQSHVCAIGKKILCFIFGGGV